MAFNNVSMAIEDGAGNEIIEFHALSRHGSVCELDHLWAAPERIGTRVGRTLYAHALQRARAAGAKPMVR